MYLMGKRKFLVVSIGFILTMLLLFSGCGSKTTNAGTTNTQANSVGITDKEILVGSVSPLSGYSSSLGIQLTQGSQAYFNTINDQGGINGRKISFITADDKYEPTNTVNETTKMITQNKIFTLFDFVGTPTSQQALPIIKEANMPLVGVFTGAEFLRNPIQPDVINIRASYNQEASTIVDYWLKQGKKKIAVFYQNDAFGLAVLSGTKLALEKQGLEPTALATVERNTDPVSSEVDKIVQAKPDAVVMVGTYANLSKFVKMAKDAGLKDADYATVSFVGSEAFAKELGNFDSSISNNVIVSQVVPDPFNTSVPVVKEYQEAYAKYYPNQDFNYIALEGFVNAKILVEGLRECGNNLTHENLIKQLESLSKYDVGIGQTINISSSNHQMFDKVYLSKLQNGKFITIQ